MDLIERIFSRLWKPRPVRIRESKKAALLRNERDPLLALLRLTLPDLEGASLEASLWHVGFVDRSLFLPEAIALGRDLKTNQDIYRLLTLRAAASFALGLWGHVDWNQSERSRLAARVEFLAQWQKTTRWLDDLFPGHRVLESEVFRSLGVEVSQGVPRLPETALLSQPQAGASWTQRFKRNDELSEVVHALVPTLPLRTSQWQPDEKRPAALAMKENQENDHSKESHKERDRSELHRQLNLDDEDPINPVTHSFEKMETADDYNRGRRFDSGDDELEDHANALEEVELNHRTAQGENAKSTFQQSLWLPLPPAMKEKASARGGILYPEWSGRELTYLEDHCMVFEQSHAKAATNLMEGAAFRQQLSEKYRGSIEQWQRKLSRWMNVPRWRYRQQDGSEIDVDSVIRAWTDIQAGSNPDPRWYAEKSVSEKDLAVLVLMDQSMSTDSWVGNQRVFDIIREAVGVSGLLFQDVLPAIMVAGTSSETRHHIEFEVFKDFSEGWNRFFDNHSQSLPRGYTRLGPALRHANSLLRRRPEQEKILIFLTDGKPSDLDAYEGRHGILDVRRAVKESEDLGHRVIALAIDHRDRVHFEEMFRRYSLLPTPEKFVDELLTRLMGVLRK